MKGENCGEYPGNAAFVLGVLSVVREILMGTINIYTC